MYVCWDSKKRIDPSCNETYNSNGDYNRKTLGKRYKRLGDAWYKMWQLHEKDYDGIHVDFEAHEAWTYTDKNKKKTDIDGEGWWFGQNADGSWYMSSEYRCVDITSEIEYFKQYRNKEKINE